MRSAKASGSPAANSPAPTPSAIKRAKSAFMNWICSSIACQFSSMATATISCTACSWVRRALLWLWTATMSSSNRREGLPGEAATLSASTWSCASMRRQSASLIALFEGKKR